MINTERFVQLENGGDRHNNSKCFERVKNINLLASNSLHYWNFIKEVGTILESYSGPWTSGGSKIWYIQGLCIPWCWLFRNVWAQNPDDLACAKSCTGFIITFADCPVLWISIFKTETNLSTMEAETIVLDHCCRDLFPIINITQSLKKAVGMTVEVP